MSSTGQWIKKFSRRSILAFCLFSFLGLGTRAKDEVNNANVASRAEASSAKVTSSTALFYANEEQAKLGQKFNFKMISKEEKTQNANVENLKLTATFENPAGETVLIEKGEISNGDLLSYEVDLKQLEESALVQLQGTKILASFTEKGKSKSKEFERPNNFVLPANYVDFVQRNWDNLIKRKKIEINFYVWQRLDYYRFDLIDKGEEAVDEKATETSQGSVEKGSKYRHFRLEPSSSFLSIFVSPIDIWFDPKTRKIMRYKGRVTPLISQDSKLKPFDAVVIYNY